MQDELRGAGLKISLKKNHTFSTNECSFVQNTNYFEMLGASGGFPNVFCFTAKKNEYSLEWFENFFINFSYFKKKSGIKNILLNILSSFLSLLTHKFITHMPLKPSLFISNSSTIHFSLSLSLTHTSYIYYHSTNPIIEETRRGWRRTRLNRRKGEVFKWQG